MFTNASRSRYPDTAAARRFMRLSVRRRELDARECTPSNYGAPTRVCLRTFDSWRSSSKHGGAKLTGTQPSERHGKCSIFSAHSIGLICGLFILLYVLNHLIYNK